MTLVPVALVKDEDRRTAVKGSAGGGAERYSEREAEEGR